MPLSACSVFSAVKASVSQREEVYATPCTVRKKQSRDLPRWTNTAVSTTIFPISFSVIFHVFRCSLRLYEMHKLFLSPVRFTHSLKTLRTPRDGLGERSLMLPSNSEG
jgi:hypothetical protein